MPSGALRTPLTELWMLHAVRALEQTGPLDDAQAMAEAFRGRAHSQDRLRERAWLLGQRLGLPAQMARWRDTAWWLGAALAVAVVLMANGMVFAMLTQGRNIHAGSAVVAALGAHGLTLALWLGTLVLAPRLPGAWGRWSLGALLLRALAWFTPWRGAPAAPLAAGASQMLRQAGLAPWAFGLVSHLVWAASFVWVLLGLLWAFAFREYRLTWESTIFGPAFFQTLVQVSGWLPAQLGFAVPDGAVCMAAQTGAQTGAPTGPDTCARAAAWWLLGCVAVYGLVPRLLCAALCAVVWQRRKNRMDIDTSDPYVRQLLARWDAMAPSRITDPEHIALAQPGAASAHAQTHGQVPPTGARSTAIAVVGFELAQAQAWPPPLLAARAALVERIAGTQEERRSVLDALAQLRPAALVLACNAAATPDRGTERFVREACSHAGQCALWLALPDGHAPAQPDGSASAPAQRWRNWLDARGLHTLPTFTDPAQAQAWAESLHAPAA